MQRAFESGARGVVYKETSAQEVCRAIRQVHAGKTFFSPAAVPCIEQLRARKAGAAPLGSASVRLTAREWEVLHLIAQGRANKQTAAELGISPKTVDKHREHLMRKLGIHDTAGLTRYAIASGFIQGGMQPGVPPR